MSETNETSCLDKTKAVLRELSLGKYPGSLYHRGKLQYSTSFGGIITLGLVALIITYAVAQIRNVFYIENNFSVQYSI
jgi:hypothetical protein